jgi:formyl-CoA transferase
VRRLAASAAILVESFRPGVLEDMGLAPSDLHALNPKLVVVRISGWGQDGRYRHKPGFGTLIEGYSGFASMNGFADREPVLPPMYLADCMAALNGYGAVMVALREVEVNGGNGQVLDLPLFDPLFSMLGPQAANYRLTGEVKVRTGSRSTNAAPRNVYQTKDGHWVCLSASTQGMAERVLAKIGKPELVKDPRFATNIERVRNGVELDRLIGDFVGERNLAENLRYFDEAGVTIGPVYDISQIVQDDYVLEREAVIEIPDAEMGELPTHPVVPRLSATPGALKSAAPTIGEHNETLLRPLLGEATYAKLCRSGVISKGRKK